MPAPSISASALTGAEFEGTDAPFTVPGGAASGEAIHVGFMVQSFGPIVVTPPGGAWSLIAEGVGPQPSEKLFFYELKQWDGVTTKFTFTWGGAKRLWQGGIVCFKGADTKSPRNASGTISHVDSEELKEVPVNGLTTTAAECRLVIWTFNGNGFFGTAPGGWTEIQDQLSGPEIAHKELAAAGAQAGVKVTLNNVAEWGTLMVAVQPPQPEGAAPRRMTLLGAGR